MAEALILDNYLVANTRLFGFLFYFILLIIIRACTSKDVCKNIFRSSHKQDSSRTDLYN